MKKTLIALAAVAATGAAFAQSTVTLGGAIDLSLASVENGNVRTSSMLKDGVASSNIQLRGTEDLGGGLKAGFHLEATMNPDDGTGLSGFDRRSTLSVMGGFGEIRLGRDYTPTFWNHANFTAFGTNGIGASNRTFDMQNGTAAAGEATGGAGTTLVRANNSVSYHSPTIAGFTFSAMAAMNEAAGRVNKYNGARLVYRSGPIFASIATGSEGSNVNTSEGVRRTNAGIAYDFGVIRPMLFYVQASSDPIGAGTKSKQTQTGIGFTAPVGPGTVKFQYIRADENVTAGNRDATHTTVGYDYPLSKRTAAYATYSRINNKTGSAYSITGAGGVANTDSSGYQIGLRHSF